MTIDGMTVADLLAAKTAADDTTAAYDTRPPILDPASDSLLTATMLKRRWGDCSDMLLHRRTHDDPDFPPWLDMHGRKFMRLSQVLRYEWILAERAAAKAAARAAERAANVASRAAEPTEKTKEAAPVA
jgi:hypothetical protein